jgi:hypothetical protein
MGGPASVDALAGSSILDMALRVHQRTVGKGQHVSFLCWRGRKRPKHEGIRTSNIAGTDTLVLQGPGGRCAVPLGGRFRVDHGLGRGKRLSPGAASRLPIAGLSTIFWQPAGSRRSCRTMSHLRFRSAC